MNIYIIYNCFPYLSGDFYSLLFSDLVLPELQLSSRMTSKMHKVRLEIIFFFLPRSSIWTPLKLLNL